MSSPSPLQSPLWGFPHPQPTAGPCLLLSDKSSMGCGHSISLQRLSSPLTMIASHHISSQKPSMCHGAYNFFSKKKRIGAAGSLGFTPQLLGLPITLRPISARLEEGRGLCNRAGRFSCAWRHVPLADRQFGIPTPREIMESRFRGEGTGDSHFCCTRRGTSSRASSKQHAATPIGRSRVKEEEVKSVRSGGGSRKSGGFRGWDGLGFRKLEVQKWEKEGGGREGRGGGEGGIREIVEEEEGSWRERKVERSRDARDVESSNDGVDRLINLDGRELLDAGESSGGSGAAVSAMDLNCKHFQRCSGCTLEHALDKPPLATTADRFFHDCGFHEFKLSTGDVWEWRCRAKLVVQGTSADPVIGLYEGGTHRALNIPSCRAHHPHINAAAELVRRVITRLGIEPYDETTGRGQLRYLQLVVSTNDTKLPAAERYIQGKVQVSLVWNARDETGPESELLLRMAEVLYRLGGPTSPRHILHSVWANFQTSRSNVILGQRWRHLRGDAEMWERMGGVDVCFTPASFGQANYRAFEALLRSLQRHVPRGSRLSELYAGVGGIGLSLASSRQCRRVRCVEVNSAARAPFEASLKRLPASLQSRISWHCADAGASSIKWLHGADVVVVDPPRKGLEPPVIEALRLASIRGRGLVRSPSRAVTDKVEKRPWIVRAQKGTVRTAAKGESTRRAVRVGDDGDDDDDDADEDGSDADETDDADDNDGWPHTLIYVSCGWEAFQEDCRALLKDNAWHLHHAEGFQFFPGTDSMETLAVFKVGTRPKKKKKGGKAKGKVKTGPKKEKRNKSRSDREETIEGRESVESTLEA